MKTPRFSRAGIIGLLLAIGLILSTATSAFAVTADLEADVTVTRAALQITAVTNLIISLNQPTTGTENFIAPNVGSCATGSQGSTCASTAGEVFIQGNTGSGVEVTAPNVLCTNVDQGSINMNDITFNTRANGGIEPLVENGGAGTGIENMFWGATFVVTSDVLTIAGLPICLSIVDAVYNP